MTLPKEKDPISLEMYEAMLTSTGAAISRLKKRLKDTNMAFQLKPPEDEKFETLQWEQKINNIVNFKEKYDFPSVMEIKRARAKRQQGIAEKNAEKDRIEEDRKAMHAALAKEANQKLAVLRLGKNFGKANTFGGPGEGEPIKTIERYDGANCVYKGERTLIRKDGRFTKQVGASEIPPWIGPQYYSNLDPAFLAKGLFPPNISQIPFKSATSGRNIVGHSAEDLRDSMLIRRERLTSFQDNDNMGPRYLQLPERLSPERVLRHHGYVKTDEGDFLKENSTVDGTVVSAVSNPWAATDRRPPMVMLGELTRQIVLVEKEDAMHARLPPRKREQLERGGVSPLKTKVQNMLAAATSYLTTSNTLSAKLARHERSVKEALDGGIVNGRIDYTKGALNGIDNVGARAELTQPAPSVTGSDNASVGTSLLSSKIPPEIRKEDIKLGVADIAVASPVKFLLLVGKEALSGDEGGKGKELSAEEKAKEEIKAENMKIQKMADERKKEHLEKKKLIRLEYEKLSPIKKTFSKRKLPLTDPIKPQISELLNDPTVVYHRSKEPEWLAAALETKREEMLSIPGILRIKKPANFDDLDDILMSEELKQEVQQREALDKEEIDAMYEGIISESEAKLKDKQRAHSEQISHCLGIDVGNETEDSTISLPEI